MLAKRIIPCLDVHGGRVVKGVQFVDLQDAGDPVEQGQVYDAERADELVFLDITASHEGRDIILEIVRRVADTVFIPFTVGGGIRTVDDVRAILLAGADKVSINTAAVENPQLITEGAKRFGSQCIVVSIDAKRRIHASPPELGRAKGGATFPSELGGTEGGLTSPPESGATERGLTSPPELGGTEGGPWEVYTHGGRKPRGLDAVAWAREVGERGAGEILLTSMDADGTQNGYDIAVTRAVADAVSIPVIASGGAGEPHHFYEALTVGGAQAALAASLFHYRQLSIAEVKRYLTARGVLVRPV